MAVTAMIVDRHRTGALLGYEQGGQQGPWIIRTIMQALHRRARLIPWSAVNHISSDPDGQLHIYLQPDYPSSTPGVD